MAERKNKRIFEPFQKSLILHKIKRYCPPAVSFLKREKYEKIYDYQNSSCCFDGLSINDNCIDCVNFFSRFSDDFHKKNERLFISVLLRFTIIHEIIPREAGRRAASIVHFQLPVSFLMVRSVVEHGQCMREKSMVHSAVVIVHPWETNSAFISGRLPVSAMLPSAR